MEDCYNESNCNTKDEEYEEKQICAGKNQILAVFVVSGIKKGLLGMALTVPPSWGSGRSDLPGSSHPLHHSFHGFLITSLLLCSSFIAAVDFTLSSKDLGTFWLLYFVMLAKGNV